MGFCRQNIKALYYENKFKPIKGKFLCLGKQSVNIDPYELEAIFGKKYLINKKTQDKSTKHAKLSKGPRITDKAFLENTFDVKYFSLDLNKYEGANITADLNYDISKKYYKKFDFIFSGGLLDNLFNPSIALINLSKLLKNNGRILIWEPSRGLVGSMLNFTPEYFYSFFSVNDYFDYKVYLLVHDKEKKKKKDNFDYYTDIFSYKPSFTRKKNFDYLKSSENKRGIHYVMAIAEKQKKSSNSKMPINLHYIKYTKDKKKRIFWNKKKPKGNRAILGSDKNKNKLFTRASKIKLPYNTDHYKYLASKF